LVIDVAYTHPDRLMAAKVADLLVNEYIAYNQGLRTDESMKAVEDLKVKLMSKRSKSRTSRIAFWPIGRRTTWYL